MAALKFVQSVSGSGTSNGEKYGNLTFYTGVEVLYGNRSLVQRSLPLKANLMPKLKAESGLEPRYERLARAKNAFP